MKTKLNRILFLVVLNFTGFCFSQKQGLIGTVYDNKLPIPGATISIENSNNKTTSDFDGNFKLTSIADGTFKVIVNSIGFKTQEVTISISPNEVYNMGAITLEPLETGLKEVIVNSAQRNSELRALNMQKNAINVMNVIAADGIGKLPDRNAAETVQRVQGVSIERDQGEGRFVSVRGLPPFWASTTINGNRIPTAEEETTSRATAFDFFPSELIAYVQVNKAITPDIEADGIGGSVNFITHNAPAKQTLNATIGSGYNDKSGKGVYNAALTYGGTTKNKKFGYLINLTRFNRNWATDNFEARRDGDEGVFRMELRDYTGIRKTTGGNLALDYNLSPKSKIYLKSMYGTLSDFETHYKQRVRFDKFNSTTNTARVELQNIHNNLITELKSVNLGGKHDLNNGTIDWELASYENEFKYGNIPDAENKSYFVIKYRQDGIGMNPSYIVNKGKGPRAYWAVDGGKLDYKNPDALFGFYSDPNFKTDAAKMKFSDLEFYKVAITEKDKIVAAFNHEILANDKLTLKYGFKYRDKERTARFSDIFYNWIPGGAPAPLLSDSQGFLIEQPGRADYLRELDTNISSTFGPVLSTNGMDDFWNKNKGNLVINKTDSEALEYNKALGRNFDVNETHADAYGMGTYKVSEKLTALGGIRLSNTETRVNGYNVINGVLTPVENTKKYLAVLPMIHLKYQANENLNLRFATTRTFARPNFGDITPGGSYVEADNEFKGGNPNLNPTYSWNIDLMGEYYLSNAGLISGGVFYKSIKDPIFQDSYQGTYNGITGVEFSTPNNGNEAWIGGLELGIMKRFDFLPGFLQYFGTQLNATLMTSEMTTTTGREVSLPYQAKQLFNAQLFFERGGFNIRAAYNYKGKYAIAFADQDKNDIYYGKYSTLDVGLSYKINKNFLLFADINNILNNPLMYHYGNSEDRPKQVEFYGVKTAFGVKFTL
ncbi:CirA Outer membrane receptor proteins, mostly Fe transport [Flavobacteriaceae bacterium]|jgi:TonB-dependent receptor